MSSSTHSSPIIDFALRNWKLIVVPAVICAILGAAYAFTNSKRHVASQTVMLRDDLLGESFKPGRFQSEESLKNAQETVLHLVRKPSVLAVVLSEVFPDRFAGLAPDSSAVESFQDDVSLTPPNGAEYGKTDVMILSVIAKTPDDASNLTKALHSEVERNLRLLRAGMLTSMQNELGGMRDVTQRNLDSIASRLQEIELQVGEDLPSLQAMMEGGGDKGGELHRTLERIHEQQQTARISLEMIQKQLEYLRQVQAEGESALATNAELLELQPMLGQLYNGLVEAKLKLARDAGVYLADHPRINEGRLAVEHSQQLIDREVSTIEKGLKQQQSLATDRLASLTRLETEFLRRSDVINRNRVAYQTLTKELSRLTEAHAEFQKTLSEVESLTSTKQEFDLLTPMGEPEIKKESGMSKSMLILLATILGGLFGLGLAIFQEGPMPDWSEQFRRMAANAGSMAAASHAQRGTPRSRPISNEESHAPTDSSPSGSETWPNRPYGSGAQRNVSQRPVETLKAMVEQAKRTSDSSIDRTEHDDDVTTAQPAHEVAESEPSPTLVGRAAAEAVAAPQDDAEVTVIEYEPTPFEVALQELETEAERDEVTFQSTPADRNIAASQSDPDHRSSSPPQVASRAEDDSGENAEARRVPTIVLDDNMLEEIRSAAAGKQPFGKTSAKSGVDLKKKTDDESATTSEKQRALNKRLEELSRSISAYCQPVRKSEESQDD